MMSPPKQFMVRYMSFSAAKVSLLIGKSVILVLAYSWLPIAEFTLMAGLISIIEITRPISDLGAENMVYARLAPKQRPLPKIIQTILRLRLFASGLISAVGIAILIASNHASISLLFALPLIIAIQNSNLAFLQKAGRQGIIAVLSFFALFLSGTCILLAYISKAQGLTLTLLLITPELLTGVFGIFLTLDNWKSLAAQHRLKVRGGRQLAMYMVPSISIGLIVMLYSRLDILFVRPMLGLEAQASYSAAFRVIEPILLLLSLASLTLLTELGVNHSARARAISISLMQKMRLWFYIIYLSIFFGLALALHFIGISFLHFSNETAALLAILALIIPVKLLNMFYSSLLQRAGKFHLILVAALITLIATFTLAFAFGMVWGVVGVVVAAIVAELINMIYQKIMVKKTLGLST